jgi:hypothetical protein
VSYADENTLLKLYGLHVAHEDDAGNEVWQLGSSDKPNVEPEFFTRGEALAYVVERKRS